MKLEALFSDHAVLQRGKEINIFGKGKGVVEITFCGNTASYTSDGGDFVLTLPPLQAGGPYEMTVCLNGKTHIIKDIMVGDVILVAGQSNTEVQIGEISPEMTGDNPYIRAYHCRHISKSHPFDDSWNALTGDNTSHWNALPYHIADMLYKERGVPIGVVCCSQGAARIQSFLSPQLNTGFDFDPEKLHPDYKYPQFVAFNHNSDIFRFMLEPIVPYTIDKVVWYQGESNTSVYEGNHYDEMLKAMIGEWRRLFRNAKLPFVIVQINDFTGAFSAQGWKLVQQAQERVAQETQYCTLVKISDLGQHDLIHPTNKKEVAQRIFAEL